MDKIVVSIILIAIAVTAAIAANTIFQKMWTSGGGTTTPDLNTEGTYFSLDPSTAGGNATIAIILHNVGTSDMYVNKITIIPDKLEVFFVAGSAWLGAWSVGTPITGAVSTSSTRAGIGTAWLVLPAKESIYITFTHTGMNQVVQPGDRYLASVYLFGSGQVNTFSITVQSM